MDQGIMNEEQKASNQPEDDQIDMIAGLSLQKEQLASEGRYLEAENIRFRINEIKNNFSGQQKKDLQEQHFLEFQNLEEMQNKENMEVNKLWEDKLNDLNEREKSCEKNLNEKHQKEMESLISDCEKKLSKIVKFSKEYYELKKSELNLVKLERYVEAHQIKLQCEYLEKIESEKFLREREEMIKIKADQLAFKQSLEKNASKQKFQTEFDVMNAQKDDQMSKIELKYKNKKADLDLEHKKQMFLSENENSLRAKNTAEKISNTMRNYARNQKLNNTAPKFQFYPQNLKVKDYSMSSSLKKTTQHNSNPHRISMKDEGENVPNMNLRYRPTEEQKNVQVDYIQPTEIHAMNANRESEEMFDEGKNNE